MLFKGVGSELPAIDVLTAGETMACLILANDSSESELSFIGAESNFAIGLAALGHSVAWVSRLGNDFLGQHVVSELQRLGVRCDVEFDDIWQTGLSIKEVRGDSTTVRYYRRDSAASHLRFEAPSARPRWIHLTGVTPALSDAALRAMREFASWAGSAGVRISFDVNYRPRLWEPEAARPIVQEFAALADLVFIGEDESVSLGLGVSIESFAANSGIRDDATLVFKYGGRGADARVGGALYRSTAREVPVVDLTGAGDAFAAGFLSGVLRGLSASETLDLGHELASRVVGQAKDFVDSNQESRVV